MAMVLGAEPLPVAVEGLRLGKEVGNQDTGIKGWEMEQGCLKPHHLHRGPPMTLSWDGFLKACDNSTSSLEQVSVPIIQRQEECTKSTSQKSSPGWRH